MSSDHERSPIRQGRLPAVRARGGFTLVIQRRKHDGEIYPEGFHIGFLVEDPAEVHARRARLAADGIAVSEVDTNARGTTCYCPGPNGLLIEVGCRVGSRVALPTH